MKIEDLTKEQILAWFFDHDQAFADLCLFWNIDEDVDWDKIFEGDDEH